MDEFTRHIESIEASLLEARGALALDDWSSLCDLLETIEEDLEAARRIAEGHEEAGQKGGGQ
jgi:hypothetical protein